MYKKLFRPFLFLLDPEKAHFFSFFILKIAGKIPGFLNLLRKIFAHSKIPVNKLSQTIWGLKFNHPIGLAAGLDKDAKCIDELACFGFSFIEIGTLTPRPQTGNPKKRLFRLPKDLALINRMGFNNDGVDKAVFRLKKIKSNIIIGGNIGKNKNTPNESAEDDYVYALKKLHPFVNYFVVNVSSPNTPNLRQLQDKTPLRNLLLRLKNENLKFENPKPLLLKVAPDLNTQHIKDIAELSLNVPLDGLVISNTTIDREGLLTPKHQVSKIGAGGLSGKPVKEKSTEIIKSFREIIGENMPIIAVGGVFDAKDAKDKIDAGANLVQIYTGLVYEGPTIVKKIVNNL